MNLVSCYNDEGNLEVLSCKQSNKKDVEFHDLSVAAISESIRNGDRAVFEYLYIVYNKTLVKWLNKKTLSQDLSEDLVHDMFLSLWNSRHKFNAETSISSYLYRILYNRLMDYYSSEKKHFKMIQTLTQKDAIVFCDLVESDGNNDSIDLMKKEVDKLPKKCKEVLVMSKYYGYKYSEIAEELEISIKTVERIISRAFSIIRQRI